MANNNNTNNSLSLHSVLENDKLIGPKFCDYERNVHIVLRHERKWYVLENLIGPAPAANATEIRVSVACNFNSQNTTKEPESYEPTALLSSVNLLMLGIMDFYNLVLLIQFNTASFG
ncbi:hypothetical protein Tco_1412866, partial [Tanacetum coccineum]